MIPRLHFLRASLTDRCLCVRTRITSAEGDRKASKETAGAKIEGNKRRIATLREENKDLVAQLRVLKNPGKQKYGAGVSMKAVNVMDEKVCGLIKKHNHVRAEALRKEKELLQLQKEMCVVFSLDCVRMLLLLHQCLEWSCWQCSREAPAYLLDLHPCSNEQVCVHDGVGFFSREVVKGGGYLCTS